MHAAPPHTSAHAAQPAGVDAKALQRAVADLQATRPGPGLIKTTALIAAIAILSALTAQAALAGHMALVLALSVLTALVVSPWFITTHDALHHTLTGWRWFDEVVPRLVSYALNWPHGTYAEVHKLHHKMEGDDFNDPERVQWTAEEYAAARPLGRFYVRHWAIPARLHIFRSARHVRTRSACFWYALVPLRASISEAALCKYALVT